MVIFQYTLYILGSIFDPCYIQNHVITNRVIKRLKCSTILSLFCFSCVYKCVCKQFSERLYADLLSYMSSHLTSVNQELKSCVCIVLLILLLNHFCYEISMDLAMVLFCTLKYLYFS